MIAANSSQAKRCVERNHSVDQDRLVKELKLSWISTIAEANLYLAKKYLPKMNKKFSRPPADESDAHVPLGNINLKEIFCFEYERTVSNDYIIRFEKHLFQILKTEKALPRQKDKVLVRIFLDGALSIIWKGKKLLVKELVKKTKNPGCCMT